MNQDPGRRRFRNGIVNAAVGVTGGPVGVALGGLNGYTSQALGDAILGIPDKHDFLHEAGRGAVGGGVVGGGIGALAGISKAAKESKLMKFLLKSKISPKAAAAMMMGVGATGGAGLEGAFQGITSGLMNRD